MDIKEQITLRFLGVDFPAVNLHSSQPFSSDTQDIEIEIIPKAFIPNDKPDHFKIIMDVHLSKESYFSLQITAIGSFRLSKEDVTEDQRKSFINANSTAIMFPYVRAFISMLTSNLGNVTKPIVLPTRFFKGDYIEQTETEYPSVEK